MTHHVRTRWSAVATAWRYLERRIGTEREILEAVERELHAPHARLLPTRRTAAAWAASHDRLLALVEAQQRARDLGAQLVCDYSAGRYPGGYRAWCELYYRADTPF